MRTAPIVAATDGTAQGEAAVRWAAREASRREVPLRIVHAYAEPGPVGRALATAVLDAAVVQARAAAAFHVHIDALPVAGDPVTALLEQEDAALLVLGSRDRNGFASLLPGAVGRKVAVRAKVPVLVVRGRGVAGGPVVAGVDDSPAAEGVLATAFEEASLRNCPLAVVRTYPSLIYTDFPAADADEHARLERQLAEWRRRYPEVDAEAVVSPGAAAPLLVAVSHQARLVVVGSRGHSSVTNVLIGSTGMELLHHAGCPVLIVRGAPAAAAL